VPARRIGLPVTELDKLSWLPGLAVDTDAATSEQPLPAAAGQQKAPEGGRVLKSAR